MNAARKETQREKKRSEKRNTARKETQREKKRSEKYNY